MYKLLILCGLSGALLSNTLLAAAPPSHCEHNGEMVFTKECINALLTAQSQQADSPDEAQAAQAEQPSASPPPDKQKKPQASSATTAEQRSPIEPPAAPAAKQNPDSTETETRQDKLPLAKLKPTESEQAPAAQPAAEQPVIAAPSSPASSSAPSSSAKASATAPPQTTASGGYVACNADDYLDAARRDDLDSLRNCAQPGMLNAAQDQRAAYRGRTALHWALLNNNPAMLKYLLGDNQLQHKRSLIDHGAYPIHLAAERGMNEAIEQLLSQGADIHSRDLLQQTPIQRAARAGQLDTLKLLLEKGARLKQSDRIGKSLLMSGVASGDQDLVRFLIQQPQIDINSATFYGTTALHYAVLNSTAITGMLLEAGARPDPITLEGLTPLTLLLNSPLERYEARMQLLIEHGADINQSSVQGLRPIDMSLATEQLGLFKELLAKGADSTHIKLSQLQDKPAFIRALKQYNRL